MPNPGFGLQGFSRFVTLTAAQITSSCSSTAQERRRLVGGVDWDDASQHI
jgi:hypothetical protein